MTKNHANGIKSMLKYISKMCESIRTENGMNSVKVFNKEKIICEIHFSEINDLNRITIPIKSDEISIFCDYIDYLDRENAIGAYLTNMEEGEEDVLAGIIPVNPRDYKEKIQSMTELAIL